MFTRCCEVRERPTGMYGTCNWFVCHDTNTLSSKDFCDIDAELKIRIACVWTLLDESGNWVIIHCLSLRYILALNYCQIMNYNIYEFYFCDFFPENPLKLSIQPEPNALVYIFFIIFLASWSCVFSLVVIIATLVTISAKHLSFSMLNFCIGTSAVVCA